MSIPLTINGAVFEYPVDFDENWGVDATGWAQAVTNGMLQMAGGSFPLTADVNFGTSFGLKAKYLISTASNPASAGYLRLANTELIEWRNLANSGNNTLSVGSGDALLYNGAAVSTLALAFNNIFVGNASNVPVAVAMSGDATIVASGALTIANNAITNAKIINGAVDNSKVASGAAIAVNKLAALTINSAVATDSSGFLTPSATTATELGYVSGVTSAIQTQLNGKASTNLSNVSAVSVDVPMNSHKFTGLSAGTTNGDSVRFEQVKVFQIVSATSTTAFSTTSSTFQTTNLSASITPSDSAHRIIIIANGFVNTGAGAVDYFITLSRGGSNILGTNGQYSMNFAGSAEELGASLSYTDSPASTSALTYAVQIRNGNNSTNITFGGANRTQSIILMEVV